MSQMGCCQERKQVHDEGKEFLFQEGVFRLKIGGHTIHRTMRVCNGATSSVSIGTDYDLFLCC